MSRATINREGRRLAKNLPGRTAMRARQEIKCNDTDTRTRACAQPELPFHPLADLFPLMEGEEFAALVADIKANGLLEDIVLYEGKVLDGRNRYRACLTAGIVPRSYNCDHFVTDPAAHVISANIYRRHLTADQRRGLIHKLLAAQPEKSDRQIAEMAKASPTTVGKVRAKMEPTVQPGQLKRTGKDGKARKQPGRRISAAAREQEARDRETCIALDAKVKDAERELAEARKQPEGLARARDAIEARARSLAAELMHVDRELAQQISEHLSRHGAVAYSAFFAGLHCELNRLEAERAGNGTDPEQASRGAAGRGSSALDAPADHAGDMPVGAAGNDVDPEQAAEQRKQAFAAMETEEPAKTEAPPVEKAEKRGRGRPKGSKNKPKVAADTVPEPVIGNDPGPIPESLRRDRVRS